LISPKSHGCPIADIQTLGLEHRCGCPYCNTKILNYNFCIFKCSTCHPIVKDCIGFGFGTITHTWNDSKPSILMILVMLGELKLHVIEGDSIEVSKIRYKILFMSLYVF